MNLEQFQVGDVLLINSSSKRGIETRGAVVTCVNREGWGLVHYQGFPARGCERETGQGAFDPAKVGTTPYGLVVDVLIVDHINMRPRTCPGPFPGNRGYDSMC